VNLAQRMTVHETGAFALLKKHLFALAPGEIAETGPCYGANGRLLA
jgi:hypothetical protein